MAAIPKWIVLGLAVLALGCRKEEEQGLDFRPCDCGNPTLEIVDRQVGEMGFHTGLNRYAIYWAIPGTIDSKKVYFLCQIPQRLQRVGLRVRFSGEAMAPCTTPTDLSGGQQSYDIRLILLEEE